MENKIKLYSVSAYDPEYFLVVSDGNKWYLLEETNGNKRFPLSDTIKKEALEDSNFYARWEWRYRNRKKAYLDTEDTGYVDEDKNFHTDAYQYGNTTYKNTGEVC